MTKLKKYPVLITAIISCAIIVVSLFILGFFGMRLDVGLGGGQQIEVAMANENERSKYYSKISVVLDKYGYKISSDFVEDKFLAGEGNTEFTRKCIGVQVSKKFSEEDSQKIRAELALALGCSEDSIVIEPITASVVAKNALFFGLSVGIVALIFFIFGWIRYDIFAGISFIVAFLHNIILYLSIVILTRIELSLAALAAIVFFTLVMNVVLVCIYEKFREASKSQDADKTPVQERMIACETTAVKPFAITCVAVLVFLIAILFVPSLKIKLVALNLLLALIVTVYTTILIGPSTYVATLEIREMNQKAIMSRNDTVNKEIKKKVKKNKAMKTEEKQ